MTKLLHLGLVVFALTIFASPSSVEAECPYSSGYSSSYYAPSYGYNSNYYAPSYQTRSSYYGGGYNNVRSQRVRGLATAAIVAGVIVAASNSNGSRNRSRSRNRRH